MVNGEMMFYLGIAAVIGAAVIGITVFIVFKMKFSALWRQLDQEYGKKENPEASRSGSGK